jgi:ABC-type spermidine/putrescine transport system permease subunit I
MGGIARRATVVCAVRLLFGYPSAAFHAQHSALPKAAAFVISHLIAPLHSHSKRTGTITL